MTNLDRSLEFYRGLLGLEEVARGDGTEQGMGIFVLLRDRRSGMKLELNWYPEGSKYDTRYTVGEGLDHIAFCVEDMQKTRTSLIANGAGATDFAEQGGTYCYVKDPDGNWIELYEKKRRRGQRVPKGY